MKDLLFSDFVAWVRSLDPSSLVGTARRVNTCPVANWLAAQGYSCICADKHEICYRDNADVMCRIQTPHMFVLFMTAFDNTYQTQDATAATVISLIESMPYPRFSGSTIQTTVTYELEIVPEVPWDEDLWGQLQTIALNKSCSPYAVVDEFGRIYTRFCRYRLAIDAAVQARLLTACTIVVSPPIEECVEDIHPLYALVVLQ